MKWWRPCKETDENVSAEKLPPLLSELEGITAYLKHEWKKNHIDTTGEDTELLHSRTFALSVDTVAIREIDCTTCKLPSDFLEHFRSLVPAARLDALEVLVEARLRFGLYVGHFQRAKRQQDAMTAHMQAIKLGIILRRVIIILSFKMKNEPIRCRETTLQFFRKKSFDLA